MKIIIPFCILKTERDSGEKNNLFLIKNEEKMSYWQIKKSIQKATIRLCSIRKYSKIAKHPLSYWYGFRVNNQKVIIPNELWSELKR